MKGKQRIIAVLNLPDTIAALQKRAEFIVSSMTNNPHFPSPNPPLATISAAITALDVAETATKSNAKGTVDVRDLKRDALVMVLNHARDFVQSVADGDPVNSVTIIKSAGMDVKRKGARKPRDWTAEPGPVSGSVILSCPRLGVRVTYFWAWSLDGKIWTSVQPTHKTQTTVTGLTPATTYYFRCQALVNEVMSDPSQQLSVVVR